MTGFKLSALKYPVPAAVWPAGTPKKTLTSLLADLVVAQLSQVSKLKLFWVVALAVKELTPQ